MGVRWQSRGRNYREDGTQRYICGLAGELGSGEGELESRKRTETRSAAIEDIQSGGRGYRNEARLRIGCKVGREGGSARKAVLRRERRMWSGI